MDRLMMEYLRKKGISNMNEEEFMNRFKDFMTKYKRNSMRYDSNDDFISTDKMDNFYMKRHGGAGDFMEMFDYNDKLSDRFNKHNIEDDDMYKMMKYMRNSMGGKEHFNESEAKYLVSEMYHMENGRKHSGEKFDMNKAKEICERYRGILPISATFTDVYVAINSQYHDYIELFKNWFNDNIEQKIIESAIIFWFKDVDCKDENKIVEYFREY